MIGCLTETTTCVVAKPLVSIKVSFLVLATRTERIDLKFPGHIPNETFDL